MCLGKKIKKKKGELKKKKERKPNLSIPGKHDDSRVTML